MAEGASDWSLSHWSIEIGSNERTPVTTKGWVKVDGGQLAGTKEQLCVRSRSAGLSEPPADGDKHWKETSGLLQPPETWQYDRKTLMSIIMKPLHTFSCFTLLFFGSHQWSSILYCTTARVPLPLWTFSPVLSVDEVDHVSNVVVTMGVILVGSCAFASYSEVRFVSVRPGSTRWPRWKGYWGFERIQRRWSPSSVGAVQRERPVTRAGEF